jgi:ATP-binding cassette subfamily F protein 3
VKFLSGGERTRLAMIRLLLEPVNCLILDEPTNHLDMRSKDVLKAAIRDFDGTVIVVSHDREFLDGLVTKVYEFGEGLVREHLGGIYDFLQKKQIDNLNDLQKRPTITSFPGDENALCREEKNISSGGKKETPAKSEARRSYEEQKEYNKKLRKMERRVEECESEIEQTEAAIAIVESQLATAEGASDMNLYDKYQKLKQQLDRAVEQWEEASIELDEFKNT